MKVIAFEPDISKRIGGHSRFIEGISPTIRANAGDNKVAVAFETTSSNDKNICIDAIAFQLCGDRDNPSVSLRK